jgi:hypothetical protein
MTRKELALALHVSPSQITRYINEKGMPFPISASEARQWHDSVILDQGPLLGARAYITKFPSGLAF